MRRLSWAPLTEEPRQPAAIQALGPNRNHGRGRGGLRSLCVSLNARNNLVGFDIDLMKAIAKETGMDFSFYTAETDQLLAGVSQCKLDLGISALTRTDEYNLYLLFSDPYYTVPLSHSGQGGNLDITGRDSLAGMAIGVMAGFPGEEAGLEAPGS